MLRLAIQSARYKGMVALPNGMTITKEKALASGYSIARDAGHAAELRGVAGLAIAEKGSSYLDQLLALPEAKDRPVAAARIAATHSLKTMPLAKASLFLSGLPSELAEAHPPVEEYPPQLEALLKRKCELHLIGLRRRAVHDRAAKEDARAIGYALDLHAVSRMSLVSALKSMSVDMDRLRDALNRQAGPAAA